MAHGRTGEVEARTADHNGGFFEARAREDVKAVLEHCHAARPERKEALFPFGIGIHSATALD